MLPASIEPDEWLDGVQGSRLSDEAAVNDWQIKTCGAAVPARTHGKADGRRTLFGVDRPSPVVDYRFSGPP